MHEMQIAQNIIDLVIESLPETTDRIERITVLIGGLNCIFGDSLNFYFDGLSKDHACLKNASLDIVKIPIITYCPRCDIRQTIEEPNFICTCGNPVQIISGEEFILESITVAE
jgi:hydrogenase nickel incorporation protein HypA/HybF